MSRFLYVDDNMLYRIIHSQADFISLQASIHWIRHYMSGLIAKLSDFINIKLLDHLIDELKVVSELVEKYQPGAELWLGETSNT